jgi:GntR family transcriptional repressor for pyruvate dehydrogenase complex
MSDIRPIDYTARIDPPPFSAAAESPLGSLPVRQVRRAHEQIADQLRGFMLDGQLASGERLATEAELARQFGVSRATVREALRLLAAQDLIRTAKGAGGGSYVTLPTVEHITDSLESSITLLSASQELSLDDLLEVRELLEVPAAGLAARRRADDRLEHLHASIPSAPLALGTQLQFQHNREFHSRLIDSCDNALLTIAARPVFGLLQTRLARTGLGNRFHTEINEHHLLIAEAIRSRAPRVAEREMRAHLAFLRPYYETAWRRADQDAERAAAALAGGD